MQVQATLHFIIKDMVHNKDMDPWIQGSAARAAAGAAAGDAASAATVCIYYVTRWQLSVAREGQSGKGHMERTEAVRLK